MIVNCGHCKTELDLGDFPGRCPTCGSTLEVYYDRSQADDAARVYNEIDGRADPPARVRRFRDARSWAVFYRDQSRLREALEQRMREHAE